MSRGAPDRGLAGLPGQTALIDALYPVGSVLTYSLPQFAVPDFAGGTFPSAAGPFVAFDKASTEVISVRLDSLMPDTWQTVDLYISVFNYSGADGNVRWEVNPDSTGAVATTMTCTNGQGNFARVYQNLTVGVIDMGPADKRGNNIVISRIGGHAADTLDADAWAASLFAHRIA